jgi:carboxylesterase type B
MTAPIVTIQDGQVKGKTAENYLGGAYYSFLGIPYGKPPVGELRFKVRFVFVKFCKKMFNIN